MRLIVGLGNPDKEYKNTRHNAGFLAIDEIARLSGASWSAEKKFKAEICELPAGRITPDAKTGTKNPDRILLVKPLTYMNKSGEAVAAVMNYYKLLPKSLGLFPKRDAGLSEIIAVIHDDLDIELGKYKITAGSRSAGHRGVQSIIDYLKTKNFKRLRIGIRTPAAKIIPAEKFVLQKFSEEEIKIITPVIGSAIESLRPF